MRTIVCSLAIALIPGIAAAQSQQKPDWAFPVPDKVKVDPRFAPDRVRTVNGVSYTRAAVDDFYNVPVWRPQMHPAMSKVVAHGKRDGRGRVRWCSARRRARCLSARSRQRAQRLAGRRR